jgi:hypothetical protein
MFLPTVYHIRFRIVLFRECARMYLLQDTLTVLASQIVFFLVGWIFFVKMLFRDYELHHSLVQFIFCINFTLSCTMFELIIFEIADILDVGSR